MSKKANSTLNFAAFLSIIVAAIVFLASWLLSKLSISVAFLPILQNIATAVIFVIGMILGWRYVINKNVAWRILYLVCFIVLLVCFVLPLLGI